MDLLKYVNLLGAKIRNILQISYLLTAIMNIGKTNRPHVAEPSCETNRSSVFQDVSLILWKRKVTITVA